MLSPNVHPKEELPVWQWWSSCGLEGQGTEVPEEGDEQSRLDEETGDAQPQCPSQEELPARVPWDVGWAERCGRTRTQGLPRLAGSFILRHHEARPDLHLQQPTEAASVVLFLLFLRGYFSAEHIPSCCHGSRDRGYIP